MQEGSRERERAQALRSQICSVLRKNFEMILLDPE